MTRKIVVTAVLFGAFAVGCSAMDPNAVAGSGDSTRAEESALAGAQGDRAGCEKVLRAYVESTLRLDGEAAVSLLAADVKAELSSQAKARGGEGYNQDFIARENKKLSRELKRLITDFDPQFAPSHVSIAALEPDGDADTLRATVLVDGTALDKTILFRREEAGFRLLFTRVRSDKFIASRSGYRIKNEDFEPRTISCDGGGPWTISPYQEWRASCIDSCHAGPWDGSNFYIDGVGSSCDYNTWGIDVYIRNNYAQCNDPC